MTKGILDGIRILDMSAHVAGQMATRLLAEAGADVVKIEPAGGDILRGEPGYIVWNRSKRSIVLDLDDNAGRANFDRLLDGADVLVHDLGPTAARARGLDDDALRARCPQLVVCGITPYPLNHPFADGPHHEAIVNARVGLMDEQMGMSRKDGPVYLRTPLGTMCAWYLAAAGIVARLMARARDGIGGPVHTSLLQGALVPWGIHWMRAERPDEAFARGMTKYNAGAGGSGSPRYQCADGEWMHVMGPSEILPEMQEILKEMNVSLPPDTANRRPTDAGWAGVGEESRIKAYLRLPRQRWLDLLWAADIPAAPCLRIGELYGDEQSILNEYVAEVDDPGYGETRQPGKPFVTTPPQAIRGAAPKAGQHTQEILAEDWTPRFLAKGKPSGLGPLAGYKVVDFGIILAAPIASMLMGHLGADVIKVEAAFGDQIRALPNFRPWNPGRLFEAVNNSKRGIAVDLKHPDVKPLIEALTDWADVVHHNLRYDAAQRLGIDAESMRARNPSLVYCHTSSYGHMGPRANWPGFDPLMQAFSGWETAAAGEGNPPMWQRCGFMDFQCGLSSLVATLLALYQRGRSGEGQFCTTSILGGALQSVSEVFMLPDGKLTSARELDANQTGVSPFDRIYRCNDHYWIMLYAPTEAQRQAVLEIFKAATPDDLEARIADFRQDHALYKLAQAGVPAEAVRLNGLEPYFDSSVNQAAGMTVVFDHPVYGKLEHVGPAWNMGDIPMAVRVPPTLGQHSREIWRQFGLDESVRERLEAEGVLVSMQARSSSTNDPR